MDEKVSLLCNYGKHTIWKKCCNKHNGFKEDYSDRKIVAAVLRSVAFKKMAKSGPWLRTAVPYGSGKLRSRRKDFFLAFLVMVTIIRTTKW